MALLCFFMLYMPMVTLVFYSFNAGDLIVRLARLFPALVPIGLEQYGDAGNAWRSFILAVSAAAIATVPATMAAIATTRTAPYRGLTFKYAFINLPLMVPEIITAVALLIVFSRIKVWTGYFGIGNLIPAHTVFCIPFAYMPIRARLENMDLTLETAAADLYATPWQAFRRITLPLLWPGILSGFMLAFIISLDDVVITRVCQVGPARKHCRPISGARSGAR